jgi:antirestriction protein ArdC
MRSYQKQQLRESLSRRRKEDQQAALYRAESSQSFANYPAIFYGLMAKGISEHEIFPRENVLTLKAWNAKGRYVRKGEHGVSVVTMSETKPKTMDPDFVIEGDAEMEDTKTRHGRLFTTAHVFHISQTEPMKNN